MKGPRRRVSVTSRRRVFDGRYKIDEYVFSHTRVAGKGEQSGVRRQVFERGDSAAILLLNRTRDVVILTEQFRIATHEKGPGYLVEAIAGSMEPGETPEDCIRREVMEETGYRVRKLEPVARFYASPGGSSERIFLYFASVTDRDLIDEAASGIAAEGEDIRRVEVLRSDFIRGVLAGDYEDAKLLVAGLWLSRKRFRSRAP